MRMHREAAYEIDSTGVKGDLVDAAREAWDEAVELGDEHGYRNAQGDPSAPTGTISFLMDATRPASSRLRWSSSRSWSAAGR